MEKIERASRAIQYDGTRDAGRRAGDAVPGAGLEVRPQAAVPGPPESRYGRCRRNIEGKEYPR
jgi:hypothetical protein